MKKLILIIILIFLHKSVYSNDLFETQIYNIEFTSNNIDDDKIREIKKIKFKSILNIFENILDDLAYLKVNDFITDDLINTFIKNILINDEKIINDQYYAKIKINFDKRKIINFLRSKNISYVAYHPDNFLLIIYEIDGINNNLFSTNNNYYKFYNDHLINNTLFEIPNLDINDRFILNQDHIIRRDYDKINNFSKKYNIDEILVVISKTKNNIVDYDLILYSEGKIYEKKLQQNKKEIDLFFDILEYEALNLWKNSNKIQNKYIYSINCKLKFYNLAELKEIRKNLSNVSIINNLEVKMLSYKNIDYKINYYGDLEKFSKILQLNKLKINDDKQNCIIGLI